MESNKRKLESSTTCSTPPEKKARGMFRYDPTWEKDEAFSFWLCKSENGNEYAHCKVCNRELLIRKTGIFVIEKHAKGKMHLENVVGITEQSVQPSLCLDSEFRLTPSEKRSSEDSLASNDPTDNGDYEYVFSRLGLESPAPKTRKPYTVSCQPEEFGSKGSKSTVESVSKGSKSTVESESKGSKSKVESETKGSKSTVEALDRVANALQGVASAISAIADFLLDQGS